MKNYISQIYNEGLGKTIYIPIKKGIDKISKGNTNKIITIIIKILYTLIALIIAIALFYIAFPFKIK